MPRHGSAIATFSALGALLIGCIVPATQTTPTTPAEQQVAPAEEKAAPFAQQPASAEPATPNVASTASREIGTESHRTETAAQPQPPVGSREALVQLIEKRECQRHPSVATSDFWAAEQQFKAYKENRKSRKQEISADVDLFLVMVKVCGFQGTKFQDSARDLWLEANKLAGKRPPNVGATDELDSDPFQELMARYWELVGTPGLADTILPAMEAALAEHEKTSLAGKPSERGRKVMADAKKYNEMTAPQLRKAEARIARMNRDPNVKRLDQQIDRTERDLHDVASKHGLESGGFVNRDLACRTNSSAAQRVCALSKRLAQLTDKRIAFEKRYGVRD